MSHIKYTSDGEKLVVRDIVDDLKEFIARYEFQGDELERLQNDYQQLEDENERLRKTCVDLLLTIMDYEWEELELLIMKQKSNRRKWRSK